MGTLKEDAFPGKTFQWSVQWRLSVKANETLPPKARRLVKWASIGFLGAVVLEIVLMTFLDFWTAFYVALGLYLALVGPLNAAAQRERVKMLHDRNRGPT